MLETMRLDPAVDFTTMETLGNTGSVAVPVTMALAVEQGHFARGDRVAALGIGSGINCLMIGIDWQGAGGLRSTGPSAAPRAYRTTRATISGSK
jgi:3-oxoacyl-[acyl-carrier-protein] synthase-3